MRLLKPEYSAGNACGNCILLKGPVTQPELEEKLIETLRHNASQFLPPELRSSIRIVKGEEVKKYWEGLPSPAIGWVYIPPAPEETQVEPRRKRTASAI